jgi:hypothetical protein
MEWIVVKWATITAAVWTARAMIEEWIGAGVITAVGTAVIVAPSGIIITRSAAATDANDRRSRKD